MKEISDGLILEGYNMFDDKFIMELFSRLLSEYDVVVTNISSKS